MKVIPIKTDKIHDGDNLENILDKAIIHLEEGSVVAISAKIVSICEGNVANIQDESLNELIEREADLVLEGERPYGMVMTIKNDILAPNAGIDGSNTEDDFVLWPKNPQKSANSIRKYLREKLGVKKLGVVITDSRVFPLQWGTLGNAIAFSGFRAINDYIGTEDLFGRTLEVSKANVAVGLAAAAVLVMGEGAEQTPIAIISECQNIEFNDEDPSEAELADMRIPLGEDLFSPILQAAEWRKGKRR